MKKLLVAAFNLLFGCVLGLIVLELVLQLNTGLLLRGMGLPAPADPPLTSQVFDVRYSDGDLFYWQPDLIRPIRPDENRVEAQVHFQTDEFGFPNAAPISPQADIVVLGRSYSMGAQATNPWPRVLAGQTGLKVLNLSQTGSDIAIKKAYLSKFGLPRKPRWVILEVLPAMDIVDYSPASGPIITGLPFTLINSFGHHTLAKTSPLPSTRQIYPLKIDIPGRTAEISFFSYYLAPLSISRQALESSSQWAAYRAQLLSLIQLAQANRACLVLLYVPTNANIYLPLATQPGQFAPAFHGLSTWRLDSSRNLVQDVSQVPDLLQIQKNAPAARDLLADFAQQQHIPFIDPTETLTQAALAGIPPYMTYDTHWSETGHRRVAQLAAKALQYASCP